MNLIIRPAVNFDEGTRYIVALRNLKDADGNLDPGVGRLRSTATASARATRHRAPPPAHGVDLPTLWNAGIPRHDLYLAWDFTVASERNNTQRALSIRNDVPPARRLRPPRPEGEGSAPVYMVTSVRLPELR